VVGTGDSHEPGASRKLPWRAESVPLALYDQHRNARPLQLGQPRTFWATGRMEGEGERQDTKGT
jgi:hypothetical protein